MSELPPEQPATEPPDDSTEPDGNVALPVPVDSPAASSGDGGSPAETLPPTLPT
ncbi:hypothetical protein [Streptomyces antnestii]|uniref:hypothetical protein n=1 Tax=Streptomyces antnestii TaxID=2494256 RepID=UPI00167307BD|nr:hypothetical protein [Streptomyces sp. San01]